MPTCPREHIQPRIQKADNLLLKNVPTIESNIDINDGLQKPLPEVDFSGPPQHMTCQPHSARNTAMQTKVTSICHDPFEHAIKNYNPEQLYRVKKPIPGTTNYRATLVEPKDMVRILEESKIHTLSDKVKELAAEREEIKRQEEITEAERAKFKLIDDTRKELIEAAVSSKRMTYDDITGSSERKKVLEASFQARNEQTEEVKRVNRFILNAKCHAVRDAQIHEKNEIDRDARNENLRLENLIIAGARKSLKDDDDLYEKKKAEKHKYAKEIRKQLNERDNLRYIEADRIEHERQATRHAHELLIQEEKQKAIEIKERKRRFRNELLAIEEMRELFKKMACEQERESDMRMVAYIKAREEREKALKETQQVQQEESNRRQERLFLIAKKIMESKNQRDEMSYLREQEKVEREYRRKEKDAALQKKLLEQQLIEARDKQLEQVKLRRALQIAREEKEFNKLLTELKKDETKFEERDEKRKINSKCYRNAIIKQINDKELDRRRLLDLEKQQALEDRIQERRRQENIETVIQGKLDAMRSACLPERYIKDVEKQITKIFSNRKITAFFGL